MSQELTSLPLLLSEARDRGVGAKLFTSRVAVLPPKKIADRA